MIIKVKEPLSSEYSLIKKDQIVYTYFHFASSRELTEAMIKSNSICIAYETVENKDRSLPLLTQCLKLQVEWQHNKELNF